MCFSLVRGIGPLRYTRNHVWLDLTRKCGGITMYFVPPYRQDKVRVCFHPFLRPRSNVKVGTAIGEVELNNGLTRLVFSPVTGPLEWVSSDTEVRDFNQELFKVSFNEDKTSELMPYENYLDFITGE